MLLCFAPLLICQLKLNILSSAIKKQVGEKKLIQSAIKKQKTVFCREKNKKEWIVSLKVVT